MQKTGLPVRWRAKFVALFLVAMLSGLLTIAFLPAQKAFAALGVYDDQKVNYLIYPTFGNPSIIKSGDTLTIEFCPRRQVFAGSCPEATAFEVTLTSSNDAVPVTRTLPVESFKTGLSTRWPEYMNPPQGKDYNVYHVNVPIPYWLPHDLYNLTVKGLVNGSWITDSQPNALSVVDQYKTNFSFIQVSDIHVFGPECNYPTSNQKERSARRTSWDPQYGYGSIYLHKFIQQVNRMKPDFIINTGDNIFGQKYFRKNNGAWGYTTEYEYEMLWFYQEMQKLEVPVFMTIGNHDGYRESTSSGAYVDEDWHVSFRKLYGPLYHSFDYGPDYRFYSLNSMDWTSLDRNLTNYFGIIMQPGKYLGAFRNYGDTWESGVTRQRLDYLKNNVDHYGQPSTGYGGQLKWLANDLRASQGKKMRIFSFHHDPWKEGGSGSMWESGQDPITGDMLDMGDGPGRLAILQLMRDYKVQLYMGGHDHVDYHAVLNWSALGLGDPENGTTIDCNSTSVSFQADGNSTKYPGYQRIWINDTEVQFYDYTADLAYPIYKDTNVGGTTNLHNLSAPAVQWAYSPSPPSSAQTQTCQITNYLPFKNLPDCYMEFYMPYLSGGGYYDVTNGTLIEQYDNTESSPDRRIIQVRKSVGAGYGASETVTVSKHDGNDGLAPTGSVFPVLIAGGADETDTLDVTLNLSASDTGGSGIKDMLISNDPNFTGAKWEPYRTTRPWTLAPGEAGPRTVYVKYRDNAMPPNESVRYSDDIQYTPGGPPPGPRVVSVSPGQVQKGSGQVQVTITGAETHFNNTSEVFLDGYPDIVTNDTEFVDQTHMTTRVSAAPYVEPGPRGLYVVTKNPYEVAQKLDSAVLVVGFKPVITNVSPPKGKAGTTVTITGDEFMTARVGAAVYFNGVEATNYVSWSNTEIKCKVPLGATSGPITVRTPAGTSDGYYFKVPVPPHITSITPNYGEIGDRVTIKGSEFGGSRGTSFVSFNGSDVSDYLSWSDTEIKCLVPQGARTGGVTVTTANGTSDPYQFKVDSPSPSPNAPWIDSISPTSGKVGTTVTIKGQNFNDQQGTSSVCFKGTPAGIISRWSDTTIKCQVPQGAMSGPVTVTTDEGTSNGKQFTVTGGTAGMLPTWYLAEGSTDWGFETYVTIHNPNKTQVTAQITYMTPEGPRQAADVVLAPESQAVIGPRNDLGAEDFSTRVTCKEGKSIAVDRRMIWTGPGAASPEGHCSLGVTSPANTWYLPEGSSDWGFECWLLIQNPNDQEAKCKVTYMIEGRDPQTFEKTVPANSRQTYNMANDIGAEDASIKVESEVPVIPERAMYRNNRREGHDSIGTIVPAPTYYLAEGTTDWGFTTYVLVQNPNPTEAKVTLTYMTPEGPVEQKPFTMEQHSRKTIRVNDQLPGKDLSTMVSADKPIIAERAMYWDNGTGEACHDSIGMSLSHTKFYLPDGETTNGHETWTLVQNPNEVDVSITVNYHSLGGTANKSFNDTITAGSRKTYSMGDLLGEGRAAVMVECTTQGRKIIVERAMYWNARGAGTDTIGGYSD